jgi:hypothetical protein
MVPSGLRWTAHAAVTSDPVPGPGRTEGIAMAAAAAAAMAPAAGSRRRRPICLTAIPYSQGLASGRVVS